MGYRVAPGTTGALSFPCPYPRENGYPCNRCALCRSRMLQTWECKLRMEAMCHPFGHGAFITATYAPEHAHYVQTPDGPLTNLSKRDVQDCFRAMRRRVSTPLRYYAHAHYGDRTGRAHWHACVFGPPWEEITSAFEASWQKGNRDAQLLSGGHYPYILRDLLRFHVAGSPELRGREKPFSLMSRRPPIGWKYLDTVEAMYRTPQGQRVLEENGDVVPALRWGGYVKPLGYDYTRELRRRLGIPLLAVDRDGSPPVAYDRVKLMLAEAKKARQQHERDEMRKF